MENYICKTCGVEFTESESPPINCPICDDPRQYVGWEGQQWTTMSELRQQGYSNEIRKLETGLTGIGITPSFSIGQRALLLQTPGGNVLYDCISLLDESAIATIRELGGIQAICFSHPHFYDSMVSWSIAFDDATVIVPEADREHVMRQHANIQYWNGEPLEVMPGATLIQCGGHFDGSAVLHWSDGADGKGALFVGDSITVVPDRRFVSFMTSYPNLIPLSATEIQRIVAAVEPYEFARIYGGWWGRNVMQGGKEAVRRSAARYIEHIERERKA